MKYPPPITLKLQIASKWINKEYKTSIVLDFVGLNSSTYYSNINRDNENESSNSSSSNNPKGRPVPGYSLTKSGEKISDEQIEEWLLELVAGDGLPCIYRKLTVCLKEDYRLKINKKKVYRLCKELDKLRPQRKTKKISPKKIAKQEELQNQINSGRWT